MKTKFFVALGIILIGGIAISNGVDEGASFSHPYTSLTPGALRADPQRTKALIQAASKTYELMRIRFEAGAGQFLELYPASKRLMELEVSLANNKGDARSAIANHASRMNSLRKKIAAMVQAGMAAQDDLHYGEYAAIEAEILLLNAGGRLDD